MDLSSRLKSLSCLEASNGSLLHRGSARDNHVDLMNPRGPLVAGLAGGWVAIPRLPTSH